MTTLTALLPLAVVAVMYWRRARTLARRGAPVPGWRQGSFALALVLASAAQLMPYEDELFAVHALEHLSFFGTGVLMWAAVVEVLPGPEWFGTGAKFGYVAVVRLLETVLGNVFIWSGDVVYDVYARGDERFGISPLEDQGLAGTIMMVEGSLVTIGALAWLFLKLAREGELRQRLLEEGFDPRTVRRAVRYGRGEELESAR